MKKLFGRCQNPGVEGHKQWSQVKQKLHSWTRLLKCKIFQQLKQEQTEESGEKQKPWQEQREKRREEQKHEPRQTKKQLTSPFFPSQRMLQVARTDCTIPKSTWKTQEQQQEQARQRRQRKLRRIILRRKKQRKQKKLDFESSRQSVYDTQVKQKMNSFKQLMLKQFGFLADPNKPTWYNSQQVILQTPVSIYVNQPTNNAIHNLCKSTTEIPLGSFTLLGLGLNFCIKHRKPTNSINNSLKRF